MDRTHIVYFLEDIAQEGFVMALVTRVATEESIGSEYLNHDVRRSPGSEVLNAFRDFVKHLKLGVESLPDVLVVAVDGNCKRYQRRVRELGSCFEPTDPLKQRTVYAVPDPHIERWYLLDQGAFRAGVGGEPPALPAYKCKRDYYKGLLIKAFRDSGIASLLGGAEFAERIVQHMDFPLVAELNSALAKFLEDLRRFFKLVRPGA